MPIKYEPLVYTKAWRTVQKRKKERLGQYNSNNKLIHEQYTSRYNLHLSLSLSLSHSLSLSLSLPLSLSLASLSLSLSLTQTHRHTHTHTHQTASQVT